jgi:hypothetical protein
MERESRVAALPATWSLLRAAFADWMEDRAPTLGAALAYYTALSIAPLLLVAIGIAGVVFGEDAARGQIVGQLRALMGDEGARAIQDMLANARRPASGVVATVVGIVTLLAGASGVFGQLQEALDVIWEVAPRPGRGWMGLVRDRFLSLTMVLGTGFLLLVSLVASAAVSAAGEALGGLTPGFEALAHAATRRRLPRGRDGVVRDDLPVPSRCGDRMARRLGRRGDHGAPVRDREVCDRPLPRARQHRLGVRGRGVVRRAAGLGLLLRAGAALRRRGDAGVRGTPRTPRGAEGGCRPHRAEGAARRDAA